MKQGRPKVKLLDRVISAIERHDDKNKLKSYVRSAFSQAGLYKTKTRTRRK